MKSYPIWNEYQCTQSQRMTQKLAWFERRQVKKGAKKKKKNESDGGRERERRALSSPPHFSSSSLLRAAPYYLEAQNRLTADIWRRHHWFPAK